MYELTAAHAAEEVIIERPLFPPFHPRAIPHMEGVLFRTHGRELYLQRPN